MADRFSKDIVAYVDPLSVRAGESLGVCVSCETSGDFDATLVELVSGDARPRGTGFSELAVDAAFAGRYRGEPQALTPGSFATLPNLPAGAARTFACYFHPTLIDDRAQTIVAGPEFRIAISTSGVRVVVGAVCIDVAATLQRRRWHRLVVTVERDVVVHVDSLGASTHERTSIHRATHRLASRARFEAGDWTLAREAIGRGHFNGRLEAVRIYAAAIDVNAGLADLDAEPPSRAELLGAWDFALEIGTQRIVDVSGQTRHGTLHQTPTRGVRGVHWRGDVFDWRQDPRQYAAIHFHEDDLTDAGWKPTFHFRVPATLASGVYAIKLTRGACEDYSPFYVRPAAGAQRNSLAFLASTATYLAYANQRRGFVDGVYTARQTARNANDAYVLAHPEIGYSLYETHRDGSGVQYSSRRRPILNLKPKCIPWSFTADTNITAWLARIEQPFDVVTDEDLQREGAAALDGYRALITGTHPEYYSTTMLNALSDWLGTGGRLMYMGGNGFYWRIAYCADDPAIIEVRRAEDGTRAWSEEPGVYHHAFGGEYGGLWRRLGRPPNILVGVGFAAQGFDGGTYYRLTSAARDPRAAFIVDGLQSHDVIGRHGTQGGGAAGEEIDRFDEALGSPPHALVIARSENHRPGMLRVKEEFLMMRPLGNDPDVRADMTFFETPSGGAVFSTGSISYAGSLSTNDYRNDIARLTGNVLARFLDPEPFRWPR